MLDTSKFHVNALKKTATFGRFELSPLVGGFGETVGNGLRRTLLVSIPGSAITKIKIDGVNHLFTTLPGVKEDLVEISLNLKKIKFTYAGTEPIKLVLNKKGKGEITASDIEDSSLCKVATPDIHIATLTEEKAHLKIELTVERGVGYTMAREQTSSVVGEIILDATFSPVLKANYIVEPARVGKKTNFDKLVVEVTTDGSIDPHEALRRAASDLIHCFSQIVDPKEFEEEIITVSMGPANTGDDISVEEVELPLRVTNALKKAGYATITQLTKAGRGEVGKSKNVGEKSLKVIDAWLKERAFSWKQD